MHMNPGPRTIRLFRPFVCFLKQDCPSFKTIYVKKQMFFSVLKEGSHNKNLCKSQIARVFALFPYQIEQLLNWSRGDSKALHNVSQGFPQGFWALYWSMWKLHQALKILKHRVPLPGWAIQDLLLLCNLFPADCFNFQCKFNSSLAASSLFLCHHHQLFKLN